MRVHSSECSGLFGFGGLGQGLLLVGLHPRDELVVNGRDDGARDGAEDEHPEVLEGVRAAVLGLGDDGRAEGARGVDGAAVDGDEHDVAEEDREADRQRRERRVALVLLVDGRLEHDVHEHEGHDGLAEEGLPGREAGADVVGAEAPGEVRALAVDEREEARAEHGAAELADDVGDALNGVQLTRDHEADRHGAVDLAAGLGADGVRERGDAEAERERHLEHPARRAGDAGGRARADEHEQGLRQELGERVDDGEAHG
mmetsp:Transcript_18424/g.54750  ORF Transcript_18424/g.54750 Transcript_18424/m.54750 type:complete len:258 (-) Transcript_18424:58-831(-)